MSKPLLSVEDLSIIYEADGEVVKAVSGLNFTLAKGETLGLIGETGAGKNNSRTRDFRLGA